MKCIECDKKFKEGEEGSWCSMECKEKFFIKYYEESVFTRRLIDTKVKHILKKVEANIIFPWEGSLAEGCIDKTREWLINKQRLAFGKIYNGEFS